jgi:hypothetical protein
MGLIRYHHGMSIQSRASPNPTKPSEGNQTTDFCIVGGGIIGKACALGLAQLGYSVIQIAPDLEKNQALMPNQFGQRIYALAPCISLGTAAKPMTTSIFLHLRPGDLSWLGLLKQICLS